MTSRASVPSTAAMPRGCPANAWTLADVLQSSLSYSQRAYVDLVFIRTNRQNLLEQKMWSPYYLEMHEEEQDCPRLRCNSQTLEPTYLSPNGAVSA